LRVFENRTQRGMFESNRAEVICECGKLHNEVLHKFYSSRNVRLIDPRRMRWEAHIACMGDIINAYKILVGKREGRGSLGKTKLSFFSNLKP
jgi:hypothetical protein